MERELGKVHSALEAYRGWETAVENLIGFGKQYMRQIEDGI